MFNNIKRLYWDCEFTGLHKNTTIISIAFIDEDNRCFYAEFDDYADSQIDRWLEDNILDKLVMTHINFDHVSVIDRVTYVKGSKTFIMHEIDTWLSKYNDNVIEMWSDCLSYDWILFVDLYGDALSIPNNIYYIPFDITGLMKAKNVDCDINREEFIKTENVIMNVANKHNALHDVIVIKACHDKLIKMK